jgi:hypothetical protein
VTVDYAFQEYIDFKKRARKVQRRLGIGSKIQLDWMAEILQRVVKDKDSLSKDEWTSVLEVMEKTQTTPVLEVIATFQFNVDQWRAAANLPEDFEISPDAFVELVVDPSYLADGHCDNTGMAVGYQSDYRESDGRKEVILLDGLSDRWEGDSQVDAIVELAELWKVKRIRIEHTPNGACPLLMDNIRKKTSILVESFKPIRVAQAKRIRISRLQTLVEVTPPLLRFKASARFKEMLFNQVEKFIWEKGKKRDRSRLDDFLDAVAILAGFQ